MLARFGARAGNMTTPQQHRPWQLHQRPGAPDEGAQSNPEGLLEALAADRVSSAAEVVRGASRVLLEWLYGQQSGWDWLSAGAELNRLLAPLTQAHGWRAPVALWHSTLALACRQGASVAASCGPREMLAEELGLWLNGAEEHSAGEQAWNGRPGGVGRRLPDRARCGLGPLEELEACEIVGVHGNSESVALALIEAHRRGLKPEVHVSEGGPEMGGRLLAKRLVEAGLSVRFLYDSALLQRVGHVDRIWLGTEAIGAQAFLGLVGTRLLLEEARRIEVPVTVLATTDKLCPQGELRLPSWGERDDWLLWEHAPSGVVLDSQPYEAVPIELAGHFSDEYGVGSAADLAVRALRTDVWVPEPFRPAPYGSPSLR
ncbi:MAG: hypothetical protein ACI8QC_001717 [Planctomycetota bacterium]